MTLIRDLNAVASVSFGDCYDNAAEESWNSILKRLNHKSCGILLAKGFLI